MISTTHNSTAVYVLNDPPDWSSQVSASFDIVTQWEESLTGREARRPLSATLRAKLRYRSTLAGVDALALTALLRGYTTQPVLCPFWPAAQAWSSRASIATTGGLRIAYKADWSQWEIYTTVEPSWPAASDMVAPLLWGRLESRDTRWSNAVALTFDVEFTESGDASTALVPSTVSWSAGPTLSGYGTAPRIWPLSIDWRDLPEEFQFRVIRDNLGFGRAPLESTYPETPATKTELRTLTQSSGEFWSLLRFFLDHGAGQSFWAPTLRAAATMTADLAGGGTALAVASAVAVSPGDYLAFVTGNGVSAFARTSTVVGTTINLATAPGALSKDFTLVCPLILSRLARPKLDLRFYLGEVVEASMEVSEVPPEYSIASDETLGTTIGILPTRAYIYEFAQTIGGTTTTTRWTSYEQAITFGGNSYNARKMNHGPIRGSLFIDRDEVEVSSEIITGDPLVKMAVGQSEAPTRLTIRTVDVSGSTGSNGAVIFGGDVVSCSVRGARLSDRVVWASMVFDRLFPRFRMQPGCNHQLFSVGCGLLSSDWKFTATVSGTPTAGYPFAINLASLARVTGVMPTIDAGWFAGGWAEFGSGATLSRRAILNNTAAVSSALTITISRDPSPFPAASSAVVLYPGCNGSKDVCNAKFGNFLNFGGHPFMPPANPSLIKMSQNVAGGKK